jgi:hypothetical protein
LENIKFLSIKFQEKELKSQIQKYKLLVCMLWFFSLLLFLSLMYFNSLNKVAIKSINLKKPKVSNNNGENLVKNDNSINNFIDFYTSESNNTAFNNITVNDTQITIDATIEEKSTFNNIVYNIEHSSKYIIDYLSPLVENNNKYSFKLTLEVKK